MRTPMLIAHADWSTDAAKRWMACARLDATGRYCADVPRPVGDCRSLIARLCDQSDGRVFLGMDFPIGIPHAYASRAGVPNFLSFLHHVGEGRWRDVLTLAERREEIDLHRPFYPRRPGGTAQSHLLDALGIPDFDTLRRRCERAHADRRAAAPLFWTLGGNQVGRAAIAGWQEILIPALRRRPVDIHLWPFMGGLEHLLARDGVVIAETYPTEFYAGAGVRFPSSRPGEHTGKRVRSARASCAQDMATWAEKAGVELAPALRAEIDDGFGERPDGEDRFDAVVGLFGMLDIVLERRESGECADPTIRTLEGWILGQTPSPDLRRPSTSDASTAYRQTTFWAFTPDDAVAIRDGEPCEQLDGLLDSLNATTWAYVTAHNPGSSTPRSASENTAAHTALTRHLEDRGHPSYPGIGVGDDGRWPAEDSLLVVGVDEAEALALGRQFGQRAIVLGERGGRATVRDLHG